MASSVSECKRRLAKVTAFRAFVVAFFLASYGSPDFTFCLGHRSMLQIRSLNDQVSRLEFSHASASGSHTCSREEAWANFVLWLNKKGGKMEAVEIKSIDGMRGLFAIRDIPVGEPIVEIPLGATIDITETRDDWDDKNPSGPALKLLKLYQKNADDLRPYLNILPDLASDDMTRMPDFYTETELEMLQCPLVAEQTRKRQHLCAGRAQELSLDLPSVKWALCTVAQRAFSVVSPVDGLLKLLLPGIDLLNHDAYAQHRWHVSWTLDGLADARFTVVAGSQIRKGEEVRICYGGSPFPPDGGDIDDDDLDVALTNQEYLQRYGFADTCFGNKIVDGKWLVKDEAAVVRDALARTSLEEDEQLLSDSSLSAASRTAVLFRQHLKRALQLQQKASD